MIRSLFLLIVGGSLLLMALRSLRAMRLKERYALLFFLTGLPFLVLAVWPDGIVFLERTLGIEKPTIMVLCLAAFVLMVLFQLLSIVSVQDRQIATLTQIVAILEQDRPVPTPTDPKTHTKAQTET